MQKKLVSKKDSFRQLTIEIPARIHQPVGQPSTPMSSSSLHASQDPTVEEWDAAVAIGNPILALPTPPSFQQALIYYLLSISESESRFFVDLCSCFIFVPEELRSMTPDEIVSCVSTLIQLPYTSWQAVHSAALLFIDTAMIDADRFAIIEVLTSLSEEDRQALIAVVYGFNTQQIALTFLHLNAKELFSSPVAISNFIFAILSCCETDPSLADADARFQLICQQAQQNE